MEPLSFTVDIDEDACTDPIEYGAFEDYQDLEQFGDEDFYLPKNLLPGVGLLTVNKILNQEASQVLYSRRVFRFSSYQLSKLVSTVNLFDGLSHIQIEDFEHNRYLNLGPIISTLLRGKNIKDLTIGKNAASLYLEYNARVLGEIEGHWEAVSQMHAFENENVDMLRFTVSPLPKLSFYNFTKTGQWGRDMNSAEVEQMARDSIWEMDEKWGERLAEHVKHASTLC